MKSPGVRVAIVDPGAFTPFHDDALCRALAARGCEVELDTAPFAYHPWPTAAGYRRVEVFAGGAGEGRASARLLRRLRRAITYPAAWRALIRRLLARAPEIVDLQWSMAPGVERRALGRLRAAGIAVVQTVHNARPHGGERSRLVAGPSLGDACDAWIAPSRATAARLAGDSPALAERIHVVMPGIAPPDSPVERAAARTRLGLEADAPIALFLGLIRPYKGVDLLLEAFARLRAEVPEARLVVAGLPRPSFGEATRQIERLGLRERVRTDLRYLPQSTMHDYLAAADLVVLPYRDASQSAVLAAALGADRPVVASAVGGLPELLAGFEAETLVPPGDVASLAGAIARLLRDPQAAAGLGRRSGAAARGRCTWEATAEASLEVYREAIRSAAGRQPAAALPESSS